MECNRDEAVRAKTIAEAKIEKRDFVGAKKFALKAQTLFPGLEGISQMLTTVNVYASAENKIGGEIDWYGVLSVKPSDDDETIRKQYRKLALMLHPDKNKSVGADGAFKLISEAWCLLSDKTKRLAYNQRRGSRGFHQKVPVHHGGSSAAPSRENGNFNFASRPASVPKTQKNCVKPTKTTPPPPCQRTDTFWTICHQCKMHYEYLKMYLNQTLLCPNCHKAFMASETSPPYSYSKPQNQGPKQRRNSSNPGRNAHDPGRDVSAAQRQGPGQAGLNSFRHTSYHQQDLGSGMGNMSRTDPSTASKAANVHQVQDKLKRHTESHGGAGWGDSAQKRKLDNNSSSYGMNYNTAQGNGGHGTATVNAPGSRVYGFPGTFRKPEGPRDLTPAELRKLLIEKAQKEIRSKLKLWDDEKNREKDLSRESKQERPQSNVSVKKSDQNGNGDSSANKIANRLGEGQANLCEDNADNEDPAAAAPISVPDPDFHDFDQDRTESSFGDNEVWAGYDDDDGMPRFYALINKVISRKPFKLRVSWLNSKTNSEFSTIDWIGSGFYKTCGEFRVGKYEICKSINSFSQKVNWSKGPRGSVLIYPQKGDVWALYKNWSSEWNENTPDEVIHKYEMAMVLDDYNEEQGISVAPLDKVVGFKTVFRPNMYSKVIKKIPKEEMFRFSHRVPHHFLTGLEAQNAPKGCLELDPAATPLELLQVMTESAEVSTVSSRANADGGNAENCILVD